MGSVPTYSWMYNMFGQVLESFPGAWQRNIVADAHPNLLAFAAVYSCVKQQSDDVAKLRIKLCEDVNGIWKEISPAAFMPVLRKPNRYQTRIQFLSQWMTSKLLYGNTYVLKERENRNVVRALYVLDPRGVTPLVASDGEVLYQLNKNALAGVTRDEEALIVPASEIIHDRMPALFHPLVGISPIYACGASATQGMRIQNNSARFFENMSRPSGMLTAPGKISDETAARLKAQWEAAYGGANLGRTFVGGDGLKWEGGSIPAQDAQLVEQQQWTVEDVGRAFGHPLHKLGAGNPTVANASQYNQEYYSHTLQKHIEDIELLLEEGLNLPTGYHVELDLEGLLRMDGETRARVNSMLSGAGLKKIDEARFDENLPPVEGGDACYLQQQNYSLAALAKRDSQDDPFGTAKPALPAPKPEPESTEEETAERQFREMLATVTKGLAVDATI
jgi:HK97 family phage portal protein